MTTQLTLFDYQQLDTETRIVVQQEDKEFDRNIGDSSTSFVYACKNLHRIHGALRYKRPGFVDYCNSKPGLSERTAYKMLDVAKMFADSANISIESREALYLLAAPSTPEEARLEAIERAASGETVTYSAAKEIVDNYRPQPNGHKPESATTFESTAPLFAPDEQLDKALDDAQNFVCPDCGEVLDIEAWHCDGCNRHWPMEKEECPVCDERAFNYKRDSKVNRGSDIYAPHGTDACQTPAYAIDPLLPYLLDNWVIWEPAAGEGLLVEALYDSGLSVFSSDILTGENFFETNPEGYDAIVTNPPFSIKFKWMERCYQLGKPFALLLPVEILGTMQAQELFEEYGIEVILLNRRVNFKMPIKGFSGKGAQFSVAWFTWGLNIGKQLSFGKINNNALDTDDPIQDGQED